MLDQFFRSLKNVFSIPDLRRRIFFTLFMLLVYRIGSHIRTPGIDPYQLEKLWSTIAGSLVGVVDLFTGGNFRVVSIFALGITPYITSSIVLQLLTSVFPSLKKVQEEGESGRQKINQYTRYGTILLSLLQSFFISMWLKSQPGLVVGINPVMFVFLTMLTLTTGTAFIMWLGEQITERGIGNGISLMIFAGIVLGLPNAIYQIWERVKDLDPTSTLGVLAMLVAMLAITMAIVFVERGHRKISINYAKRMVGRKLVGGQSTHMPLRVNMAGVIPVIFASSILTFPQTIAQFTGSDAIKSFLGNFGGGHPLYMLLFTVANIFFTFFYVSIIFNTDEIAENLRKHGGYVPGIRPGKRTADYLSTILTRLTVVGAIYLTVIAIIPQILLSGVQVDKLPGVGTWLYGVFTSNPITDWIVKGFGFQFYFGGTSLLIVIGVAMDTVNQIESQLIMRHYEGFLKKGRIRGRRD
ncbi:MAG: preprotein translocase subunit SecY [Blastocatellia bacterium]|nr:preprotein translocase subunit SecY [Blastocatellia bacterium]MBL8192990.1 preprotein translocase subunit SecY [Blastocatellia bacterium]MBN8723239.1 preprotein translocase subunit SecY [Acidobacteriota bacterium]